VKRTELVRIRIICEALDQRIWDEDRAVRIRLNLEALDQRNCDDRAGENEANLGGTGPKDLG